MNPHLPSPTVWPAALAAGITLVAAGVLTHWVVSVAGALIVIISLVGWIGLLLDETP